MNRELAEVRRYWPRAKWLGGAKLDGFLLWAAYTPQRRSRVTITVGAGGCAQIIGRPDWNRHQTIAEAMRAAGFGRRKPGFHSMLNLQRSEWHRYWLDTLGQNWRKLLWESGFPKTYATRQRPRKGARLGRRKRSPDGMGKNWRSAARGGVK